MFIKGLLLKKCSIKPINVLKFMVENNLQNHILYKILGVQDEKKLWFSILPTL